MTARDLRAVFVNRHGPDHGPAAMMMLGVGRALERMGDNTVDIGEQTAFIVTGLFREFTDASHPAGVP